MYVHSQWVPESSLKNLVGTDKQVQDIEKKKKKVETSLNIYTV